MTGKPAVSKPAKAQVKKTAAKAVAKTTLPPAAPDISTWETAWEQADWSRLANLAGQPLEDHPRRSRLALLAMAGLAQTGRLPAARAHLRQAMAWGATPAQAAVLLGSGTFNSLGRAACLMSRDDDAETFFADALDWAGLDRTSGARPELRNIQERAALGLLPDAAKLLNRTLAASRSVGSLTSNEAKMLSTQLELLNGALALAQKRGQLRPPSSGHQNLEHRATSQLGQDLWVLEQTNNKRGGFFVEFGATDGVLLSNTHLLETEFGWSGLCAEPNPAFFDKLKANRSCTVSDACIGARTGDKVTFLLADEYGGFVEHADSDMNAHRRAAYLETDQTIELTTISLVDFLEQHDAPRRIDYLSIDTEGSEYDILAAFPFHEWDIRLITVEHNFTQMREKILDLLTGHGYVRTERKWDDWYRKPYA